MSNIKYVRAANTNETKSDFINYIAEPITVGANAKISLDSLSIMIDQSKVIVDSPIDGTFNVRNGESQRDNTATIESDAYTSDSFIKALTKAINTTPEDDETVDIRTEWKPIFTTGGNLSLQYLTVQDDIGDDIETNATPIQNESLKFSYYSDNAGITVYTNKIFINSYGICNFPLYRANLSYANRFACGFINKIPTDPDAILQPEDYYLCIYAYKEAGNAESDFIKVFFNGNEITTGVTPYLVEQLNRNPTYIRAYIRAGKIGIEINEQPVGEVIYEQPYTFEETLHCAFSQYQLTDPTWLVSEFENEDLQSFRFTPSPYQNVTNAGISLIKKNEDKIGFESYIQYNNVGAAALTATLHSITLPLYTQLLFGFQKSYYETTAIGDSFTAEDPFNTFTLDSDLLVELPSLMLHSYDGTTTRRRNLIRVIPAENIQLVSGRRRYVAPYPLFISLQNRTEQILNSIQVRILNSTSNTPLPILGEKACSLTLAISSD